ARRRQRERVGVGPRALVDATLYYVRLKLDAPGTCLPAKWRWSSSRSDTPRDQPRNWSASSGRTAFGALSTSAPSRDRATIRNSIESDWLGRCTTREFTTATCLDWEA